MSNYLEGMTLIKESEQILAEEIQKDLGDDVERRKIFQESLLGILSGEVDSTNPDNVRGISSPELRVLCVRLWALLDQADVLRIRNAN